MPGKFAKACQDCGKPGPTRFRTLHDRYLCESCYRKPTSTTDQAVLAASTAPVAAQKPASGDMEEAVFDLRHLQ